MFFCKNNILQLLFLAVGRWLFAATAFLFGLLCSPQIRNSQLLESGVGSFFWDLMIFSICLPIFSFINGHGRRMFDRSRIDFLVNLSVAALLGCLVSVLIIYWWRFSFVGRWVICISFLSYITLNYVGAFFAWRGAPLKVQVVVLGNLDIQKILDNLSDAVPINRLCTFHIDNNSISEGEFNVKLISRNASYLIIGSDDVERFSKLEQFDFHLRRLFRSVDYVIENELLVINPGSIKWRFWWEVPTGLRNSIYATGKRIFDLIMVALLAPLAVPLLFCAALLIKIEDGGSIFYSQIRLGEFGLPFSIFKLRTMRVASEANGAQWASVGDNRVTKIGRILRKTRIDELPQLWNILKGEMSMIGPRPERPELYDKIEKEVPAFSLRLACKPGLTGWAQVNYPYGASIQDSRNKMLYDLFYITRAGFLFDLRIASRTVVAMVRGAR
jgi:lipopolysaccharide/colanic/teichoic acid biosynthesis glycosyltransferase